MNEFLLVFSTSIIVSVISILHVIYAAAKTPAGFFYTGTGHYYLDYFYYLSPIFQGLKGHWLAAQYFATDDPSIYLNLEPYILIGQIGKIFNLSVIATYWITQFVLFLIFAVLIFVTIKSIFKKQPFYLQYSSFLIVFLITPFYNVVKRVDGINIIPFDFWSSPSTFFKRFELVPHHTLGYIFVLIAMLLFSRFINEVKLISFKKILFYLSMINILILTTITFFPFQVVLLCGVIGMCGIGYLIVYLIKKNFRAVLTLFSFLFVTVIMAIIGGLLIKHVFNRTTFFTATRGVETGWSQKIPISLLFLNIGPAAFLSILGLPKFVKSLKPISLILLSFVVVSYLLFLSPADVIFGTHNGRFLSPINYILFGVLGTLGIVQVRQFLTNRARAGFFIVTATYLLFSLPPNISAFSDILKDKNINTPITYLPKGITEGFKYLNKVKDKRAVLTTPAQYLGMVMPSFVDKHSYIARDVATLDYQKKADYVNLFYLGLIDPSEASSYLMRNNIGFIILTSIEGYSIDALRKYSFLKVIYRNNDIIIYKVI